ncbi:Zn-dependent hydrolase [Paraliomyxa miuraensis]|uniref:Zn-dependent hydrolase n=1 Tax=Paraliomyxa miuraensis TaxID=376150 RepID=UPI0022528496|nr:Zn-dependent hydrolase [Paraliomyxa miuraensis]MCX4240867.1 Zn-dependent hydrolase [Paraliomyxa miuraensis]
MPQPEPTVDFPRLQQDLEALAAIGRHADHGIHRPAFSPAFMDAQRWLQQRIEEAGLSLELDGALNVIGRLAGPPGRPAVVTGSHIDSVPGGGTLDGALGVVAGLEALRRIRELGVSLAHPLEVVAFTDEEGRFGGMFGSQAMAGHLTPETIVNARDLRGITLVDSMQALGFDAMHALRAARSPRTVQSFVELHIEQGPVLDRAGLHVGVVEGIVGLFKWTVRLRGMANHAGTTPMNMRHDAFQGLAELAGELDRILEEHGGDASVATIGRVELRPGAANVVPSQVEFSLEARDIDPDVLTELGLGFRRAMSAIARRRGLMFEFDVLSEIDPVACDPKVLAAIEQSADSLGVKSQRLPSGAAHDAQSMAYLAPVGMIFVPSKDGRSHSPAEWTSWESIEIGANCLLRTLLRLATDSASASTSATESAST